MPKSEIGTEVEEVRQTIEDSSSSRIKEEQKESDTESSPEDNATQGD